MTKRTSHIARLLSRFTHSLRPTAYSLLFLLVTAYSLQPTACFAQVHPHSFSPRQLGIMQAWYRVDAITGLADGDPVASWVDSTANARTLTQSTADYRPAYKVSIQNGRPAIRFDGTNDLLTGAFAGSLQFTVFSVQRPDIVTYLNTVYAEVGSYLNLWAIFGDPGPPARIWFGFTYLPAGQSDYIAVHPISTAVPELWTLRYDQSWWRSWVNGGALNPKAETNSPKVGTTINVGSWSQSVRQFDGDIFELAFFNVALSDRDRQRVERYLLRKWGL